MSTAISSPLSGDISSDMSSGMSSGMSYNVSRNVSSNVRGPLNGPVSDAMTNRPVMPLLGDGPVLPGGRSRLSPTTRWTIGALGFVVLFCAVFIATQLAQDPQRFPVSNVDILGTVDYADRGALQQAVATHVGKGFYGLDIDDVRQSVERLPWIAHARVSRVWPGRIEVRVEEHEPTARWNDDKLLSKRLVLFAPPQLHVDNPRYSQWYEVFAGLPQVRGSEGRHTELLDAFRALETDLSAIGLSLAELNEDERGSRTLVLSNGVTVRLGFAEQELRTQRFLDVYERMAAKIEAHRTLANATFDMRYSNGFALGGLPGEEERATNELRVDSNELPTRTAGAFAMKRES